MAINYEDERFGQVESDKQQAMTELEQSYAGIIGDADQYYQAQIDASKQWADKQQQLQQEQTDFTIEQIEQQKQQAAKDYTKEQSGAYVDWKKQSNQYGVAAEQQAAAGMAGTGFSESSQVSMYNTYQSRVATARESYNQAVLNYNNSIKEARLQNNSVLAEIAYQALQQQLELSLQGFQYKNQLILDQANKKLEVDNMYYNRYQDVLNQINHENAFAEEIRQYEQNFAFQQEQYQESIRQFELEYEQQTKQFEESVRQFEMEYDQRIKEYNESIRQFNEEIARLKKKDEQEYKLQIQQLELQKQKLEEEKRQYNQSYALQQAQLAEQKRQFDKQYAAQQAAIKKSSGSSSKSSGSKSSSTISKGADSSGSVNPSKGQYGSVDGASVLALGYGPISASRLAQLVESGEVNLVNTGGKLVAVRAKAKGTSALNKYGLK